MTPDLRAALRAAVLILLDPVLRNDENTRVGAAERFRALADAPPTVAELLPMVAARREIHWTCPDESATTKMRATLERGAIRLYWTNDDTGWMRVDHIMPEDLKRPARLVEVG